MSSDSKFTKWGETEFRLLKIASDDRGWPPYVVRVVCVTDDNKKLVIWGEPGAMKNVEEIRMANFPCVVSCDWDEPSDHAKEKGHTGWVLPTMLLRVLSM